MDNKKPVLQSSREPRPYPLNTKGLSVVVSGIVFSLAIIKADKKDIPVIVKSIVDSSGFSLAGWILAASFLLCGAAMVWLLMRI